MNVQEQIDRYIADQQPSKGEEIQSIDRLIRRLSPGCKLSFLDGRNSDGKVVTNPNIGYGSQTLEYASGESREFYEIGVSANTAGISVYVMGLEDRKRLAQAYGARLGKAKITGYCIKFRSLKDIDIGVLEEIVADHLGRPKNRT